MSYFSGFPLTTYKFGNENVITSFQNVSAYVDIIDGIKDNINFQNPITIGDNERPDTLSQKLYGTASLYWTFFLMNDHIRERGWPLNNQELDGMIKGKFNLKTLISLNVSQMIALPIGTELTGLSSGARATVVSKRVDFGQAIIEIISGAFNDGEIVSYTIDADLILFQIEAVVEQYLSIHHWEDEDGVWHDIDPAVGTSAFYIPITYYELYVRENDELKSINVIKSSAISSVQKAFKEALRS